MKALCPLVILLTLASLPLAADQPEAEEAPTLSAKLAPPFRDHAILQHGIPLPVWGSSLPGAEVTVKLGEQVKTTTADEDGAWKVVLDPLTVTKLASVNDVPKGKTLTVTTKRNGKEATVEFEDLVAGDVWLCAGQSNMAGKMRTNVSRHHPPDTIAKANYPGLRSLNPEGWLVCSPETAPEFKKVAFFFGRRTQEDALVPIGLIPAAVGGSNIESWLNQEPYETGKNYQKLIAPLVGFGLRGMLWYQGESNTKDGRKYTAKLQSLITGWRKAWGQGDFPCYFVQLPGCRKSDPAVPVEEGGWPETRQSQFEALATANTAMAITIDIGDENVHPPNKFDTGERLARLALHHTYGRKNLIPSGPIYEGHEIRGSTVRIRFGYAKNGLMIAEKDGFLPPIATPDKPLGWLAVQDKEGAWHRAEGKIEGSELVISSKAVSEPVAARYAYVSLPTGPLLYNREGLPAAPFSTGGY